jgi:hypothetical protein
MTFNSENRVNAAITRMDRCPVSEKLRCHEISAGRQSKLVWNFVDENGTVLDLSIPGDGSESASESESSPYTFSLRVREVTGMCATPDSVVTLAVTLDDAETGQVVAANLPASISDYAGIYAEEWGIFQDDVLIYSNSCFLFVRRGLFSAAGNLGQYDTGPPTLEEIRLSLRDHVAENQLLQNREFDAAELVQAITRPLMYWNEIAPCLRPPQTTISFPFRELWMCGIQAYLLEMAAHFYRRNNLAYNAGGVAVNDRDKDNPYMAASLQLRQKFERDCLAKKVEINRTLFSGSVPSPYAGYFQ